jgi:hypothetical protein
MLIRTAHIRNKIYSDIVSGDQVRRNVPPRFNDRQEEIPVHAATKLER